ncbi:thiamine phosphate synthase [Gracilibacillus salinarum]|uniref:Thiamine phosphate synthase n=1 Tax=Gracilibacillus salinarum TaxID=2932255 RepID=A0ABY4GQV0_9BACI|nr:thiamine phosphate synthase [Gracilibacillus salinarum]UOQ86609.1 thiamine phosphate synthase [Gracilibacillus salinarum]
MTTLHLVTNGKIAEKELTKIGRIAENIDFLHVREKQLQAKDLCVLIEKIIAAGLPAKKIIINDRADLANIYHCKGVQLAYHSAPVREVVQAFPDLQVGKSVHSLPEAVEAKRDGADFILFGHVYQTQSKPGLAPKGLSTLETIVCDVSVPVIAIGGIDVTNLKAVLAAGAKGIAVMSTIWDAAEPVQVSQQLRTVLDNWKEEHVE